MLVCCFVSPNIVFVVMLVCCFVSPNTIFVVMLGHATGGGRIFVAAAAV